MFFAFWLQIRLPCCIALCARLAKRLSNPCSFLQVSPTSSRSSSDHDTEFNPSHTRHKKKRPQRRLYSVNLFKFSNKNSISIVRAFAFYHTAPVVKFCYHTVSFIANASNFSLKITEKKSSNLPGSKSFSSVKSKHVALGNGRKNNTCGRLAKGLLSSKNGKNVLINQT